jgi:acetyltransferase-like isoleucine patch superfamily enzyme
MFFDEKVSAKVIFRIRERISTICFASLRKLYWRLQGMQIGKNTVLPHIAVTWPHQVSIGNDCILEPHIQFKFDGIWKPGPHIVVGNRVFIGNNCEFNIREHLLIGEHCLIASGVKFIDHDHGLEPGELIGPQVGTSAPIILEDDVWIGANAVILQGVILGTGSVVAAGAVVRKSVAPYDIVGGVPARRLKSRKTSQGAEPSPRSN